VCLPLRLASSLVVRTGSTKALDLRDGALRDAHLSSQLGLTEFGSFADLAQKVSDRHASNLGMPRKA